MAAGAVETKAPSSNGVDGGNAMVNGSESKKSASNPFKAKITGLPSSYCLEDFKKCLTEELQVTFTQLSVLQSAANIAVLTCADEEQLEKAVQIINKHKWRGNELTCVKTPPNDLKRKPGEKAGEEVGGKKARLQLSARERVFRFNCANQHLSYKEQLLQLHEEVRMGTRQLGEMLVGHNPELLGWWHNQLQKHKGEALLLQKVVASPVVDGYRNKYDFKIGLDAETKEPVVGLKVDNQSDFAVAVKPEDEFKQFPESMKKVVQVFDSYIKKSDLPPYSSGGGHWRNFVVRVGCDGEILVMVVIHPRDLPSEKMDSLRSDIVDFFVNKEGKECGVVSVYLKLYSLYIDKNCPESEKPAEKLWGKDNFTEKMPDLGLSFIISPTSFFQVNCSAGEKLYSAVAELAHVDQDTTVLDLCCASGGVSLTLAKKAKEVFGVDILDSSVNDAKMNAEINGITNCEFSVGRIEDVVPAVLKKSTGKKVVAVLDPPREGLGSGAMIELRKSSKISKLIYLCSSQRALHKNFLDLCTPNFITKHPGKPFVPVRVIPVDLAPHTLHCCMVVLLERVDPLKYELMPGGPMGLMHPVPPMMGPPGLPGPPCPPGPPPGALGVLGPRIPVPIAGPRGPRPLGPMGPPPMGPRPPMGGPRPGPRVGPVGPRGPGPRPIAGPRGPAPMGPHPLGIRPMGRGAGRIGPRPPQPPARNMPGMKSRGMPERRKNNGDNFYQDDPLDGPSFFGPAADVQPPLPAQRDTFWR